MEYPEGKFYCDEEYTLKEIGPGVVSKGQALRYFKEQHPEYHVIGINNFKVNQDNLTVKIKVLVTKKKIKLLPDGYVGQNQKLLNPGYDELKHDLAIYKEKYDELRVGHDNLLKIYDALAIAHEKLLKSYRALDAIVANATGEKIDAEMEIDLQPEVSDTNQ